MANRSRQELIAELVRLDSLVQEKQARWKQQPAPEGYYRHEGYYGCGRLTPDPDPTKKIECGCGVTIYRTIPVQKEMVNG